MFNPRQPEIMTEEVGGGMKFAAAQMQFTELEDQTQPKAAMGIPKVDFGMKPACSIG